MENDVFASALAALKGNRECVLCMKVRAGAQKTAVRGILADGTIKLDIAAIREDGKANAALIEFLAETFSVSRHRIQIMAGHTSAKKVIKIIQILR